MSTTNDEQANRCNYVKYYERGKDATKEEPRAPMLSYDDMVRECWDENACGERSYWTEPWTAEEVGDFYEDLITSGVLRVVKKAHNLRNDNSFQCSACLFSLATAACTVPGEVGLKGADRFTCCPGCGASITRP